MNASILFSWDARGRLHAITERDASNSGYNWTATYDALNRRLSTTSILVTNGVAFTSQPNTINSYFDPQKEFLELGVNYGGTTEFKLYGPDLNGVYGGLNGIGGLDAVSPGLNLFEPTISDFRGNVLGVVTNSAVVWNPSRPTGFGAVPGYQPVALGNGADIVVSSAWRGRWADITGYYNIGLRPYDPISGRWLTYDSVWNEIDPSGMTFCGGDPVNSVDSDGRLAANGPDNGVQNLNFGTMAVMKTYLQTTTYFNDGSALITGYYSQNPSLYDPSQVAGWSYTTIRTDTGLSQFFVSESPLPTDYGQTTWTPITTWDVEQQKDTEGVGIMLGFTAILATDGLLDGASVWDLGPGERGFAIESQLGGNLPASFPTIDIFDTGTGTATSIKSIDLTAPTYQNSSALTSTINGYVDKVASFQGASWGGVEIDSSEVVVRQLQLAVPQGAATAAQQAALNAAVSRAQGMGVNLIITPVP